MEKLPDKTKYTTRVPSSKLKATFFFTTDPSHFNQAVIFKLKIWKSWYKNVALIKFSECYSVVLLIHKGHDSAMYLVVPLKVYRTRAIITRGLYIFYPIFEDPFFVFKEVFSENYILVYG